jgi:hypothetical protein
MSLLTFRRLAASAVLPTLVAGAVLVAGAGTGAHASQTRADHATVGQFDAKTAELTAATSNTPIWHKTITWHVDGGQASYAQLVSELRDRADQAGGVRHAAQEASSSSSRPRTINVDTLPTAGNHLVPIDVVAGNTHMTLVVRLADLYVIGFWNNASAHQYRYFPIAGRGSNPPFPGHSYDSESQGATFNTGWIGQENYNDLARRAGISLSNLTINTSNLEQSVRDLASVVNNQTMNANHARALLRLIVTVAEGTRFRPLANDLASNVMGSGRTLTLGDAYVALIRNWAGISEVYNDHLTNPHSTLSETLPHWGTIAGVLAAAHLLLTSHNPGKIVYPHYDEL